MAAGCLGREVPIKSQPTVWLLTANTKSQINAGADWVSLSA